jgi:plastocyanin
MKNFTIILVFVSICLLCLQATCATAETNIVFVANTDFQNPIGTHVDPTINLGDTVTWVFTNTFHSTTAAAGQLESWNSGVQFSVGATFSHTFTHVGTFNYYCSIHGSDAGCRGVNAMSGHVTVVLTGVVQYQITGFAQQGNDILVNWITGGICLTNILQRSLGDGTGGFSNNFTDIFEVDNTLDITTNYLDVGATTNFPSSYYRVRVPQ